MWQPFISARRCARGGVRIFVFHRTGLVGHGIEVLVCNLQEAPLCVATGVEDSGGQRPSWCTESFPAKRCANAPPFNVQPSTGGSSHLEASKTWVCGRVGARLVACRALPNSKTTHVVSTIHLHTWLQLRQLCHTPIFLLSCESSRKECRSVSVAAAVGKAGDLPWMQGLLLHLLQDMLPNLLEQPSTQQFGGPAHPSTVVHIRCTLSFEGKYSLWAPICQTLVRKLQFCQMNRDVQFLVDRLRQMQRFQTDPAGAFFVGGFTQDTL